MWPQLVCADPGENRLVDLTQHYPEPHRRYHTMQHLNERFNHFTSIRFEATHAAAIKLAL